VCEAAQRLSMCVVHRTVVWVVGWVNGGWGVGGGGGVNGGVNGGGGGMWGGGKWMEEAARVAMVTTGSWMQRCDSRGQAQGSNIRG
jgi:hypothetical protein